MTGPRWRFKWTAATVRWWGRLGHTERCACPPIPPDGAERTVDVDTAAAIWSCWHQAVDNYRRLSPRENVWATRAMYAFRDRARYLT